MKSAIKPDGLIHLAQRHPLRNGTGDLLRHFVDHFGPEPDEIVGREAADPGAFRAPQGLIEDLGQQVSNAAIQGVAAVQTQIGVCIAPGLLNYILPVAVPMMILSEKLPCLLFLSGITPDSLFEDLRELRDVDLNLGQVQIFAQRIGVHHWSSLQFDH